MKILKSLHQISRKKSIGRLFAVYILMFSSLITLSGTVLQLALDYNRDVSLIKARIEQIQSSYLMSLSNSLWVSNIKSIQIQLEGILKLPDMQYTEIRSEEHKILIAIGKPQQKNIISHTYSLEYTHRGKHVHLGELLVVATLEGVYQRLKERVLTILITQAIKTFLVSFFIIFLFYRLVGRYLKEISIYARDVQSHEWKSPLKLTRERPFSIKEDELDDLESAINDLRFHVLMSNDLLIKEKERIHVTLMSIGDGVIMVDMNNQIELLNPVAEQLTGWPLQEAHNMKLYEVFNIIDVETRASLISTDDTCLMEGRNFSLSGSIILCHRLGKEVFIESNTAHVKNEKDEITGSVLVFHDVTNRKKIEEELKQYRYNLEERVKQEIAKQKEQEQLLIQQSKMASIGEMIGAIAHQWRQPLNAIGVILFDIKDAFEYGEITQQYFDKSYRDVFDKLQYMSKTIDDFRNFYKPAKGKEYFGVISATEDAINIVSDQLKANDIYCTLRHSGSRKETQDVSELEKNHEMLTYSYKNEYIQVVLMLISNAKDAILESREKGLLNTREEGFICFDFFIMTESFVIKIEDNGGGIPKEIMNRIFEPYFTTKFSSQGTGIGLYMSKLIIENNMGGRIYVDNVEKGAVVTIELPCLRE